MHQDSLSPKGSQSQGASAVIAFFVTIAVIFTIIGLYYLLTDDDDVSWKVQDLRVENAGWWASVHGTLINTGTEDAEWVEIEVWVSVSGLKYYEDVFIGDVPAGGAEDFWALVNCDPTDYMTCGVGSVSWY